MSTPQNIAGLNTTPRPEGSRGGAAGPVLELAILAMGLMAGLFFAYTISVMPALARADDLTFVSVMQDINEVIQNPVFGLTFVGALVLPAVAAIMQHRLGARVAAVWIWAGFALYVVALFITMGINVPLNDTLAAVGDPSQATDLAKVRNDFEGPWVAANVVRTLLCVAAAVCLGRALALHGRHTR